MVGSAIYKKLIQNNYKNIIVSTKKKIRFNQQKETFKFLKKIKPDFVIIAAAE